MKILLKRIGMMLVLSATAGMLSSCLAAAAGAAGGYMLHEEGYRLQSPVTKE